MNKIIMKARSKSVSILNFQNVLKTEQPCSNSKFRPFVNERDLGKLIKDGSKEKRNVLKFEDINFKNFKAIYKREAMQEEARYSKLTRRNFSHM